MADYYIIGESELEGPFDLETLRSWSQTGRIRPDTRLKNAESGAVVLAGRLRGMEFEPSATPTPQSFRNPFVNSPYPRNLFPKLEEAQREVRIAWLCNFLGVVFFCCYWLGIIFFGLAIYRANLAKQAGYDIGAGARIFGIIGLCVGVVFFLATAIPVVESIEYGPVYEEKR